MILRVGIADRNAEYVSRLESVLSSYDEIEVYTYTDKEAFETLLKNQRLEVILFSEDMYFKGMEDMVRMSILLVGESENVPKEFFEIPSIGKYQRISNIYKAILEKYSSVAGRTLSSTNEGTRTIAFWSPVGGAGKTTLAFAYALRLAREKKNVLYLNLETYPGDEAYLPDNLNRGITELAADLNKSIDYELKIKGLIQKKEEHFFYMKHFDKVVDFKDTPDETLVEIIKTMEKYGQFDYIVVDLDSSTNSKNECIMTHANRICIVGCRDAYSDSKLKALHFELSNRDVDLAKYVFVKNKMIAGSEAGAGNDILYIARFQYIDGGIAKIVESLANTADMSGLVKGL